MIFDHCSKRNYRSVKRHSEPTFIWCLPIRQEILNVSHCNSTADVPSFTLRTALSATPFVSLPYVVLTSMPRPMQATTEKSPTRSATPSDPKQIQGHLMRSFLIFEKYLFFFEGTTKTMTMTLKEVHPTVVRGLALQA